MIDPPLGSVCRGQISHPAPESRTALLAHPASPRCRDLGSLRRMGLGGGSTLPPPPLPIPSWAWYGIVAPIDLTSLFVPLPAVLAAPRGSSKPGGRKVRQWLEGPLSPKSGLGG